MGNPLRVLHVVVNMNRGGAETLIMNLYRNIDRKKVQFDFLTCKPGIFDVEVKKMGGRVYRIPYISDVGHFQYIKELDEFFLDHQEYDIVHSHLDKMSGLVLRSAKKAGVRVRIAHSHSTKNEGGIISGLYKWYSGIFIEKYSNIGVACSTSAAKWLFPRNNKRTILIKNGIDTEQFKKSLDVKNVVRKELKISENTFVIGHVGRFTKVKNHTFLIDIFYEFHQKNKNSVLILIGDGPLREKIKEKIKILNLQQNVILPGIREDINRVIQAIDIIVFPSLYEGLPVTLVEAQSCGVSCLISDHISDEVDMGLELISKQNLKSPPISWANKLNRIRANVLDDDILKQIKEKGFDIKVTANWVENFYLDIKENGRKSNGEN